MLRAMRALALFDNFGWMIILEGHKLNLVTADASVGGKPDAPVDPKEQEISKQMKALKVRLEHKRRAKIVPPPGPLQRWTSLLKPREMRNRCVKRLLL